MRRLSIQKRLGLPKETKLLIIHADDIGMSHFSNVGSCLAIENGMVNSGSIMVPCPGFPEIAQYFKAHPDSDFGIHLTMTSESEIAKWKPVLPANEVPSLVDDQGFLSITTTENCSVQEIELEFRAQIKRAIEFGIIPTHIDCHQFCLFMHPELMKIYIRLGNDFGLPIFIYKDLLNDYQGTLDTIIPNDAIIADAMFIAGAEIGVNGLESYYTNTLKSLNYGLNVVLIHPAIDVTKIADETIGQEAWGSAWRELDHTFFTSDACRKILEEEKITLINWKELNERLF